MYALRKSWLNVQTDALKMHAKWKCMQVSNMQNWCESTENNQQK